MHFTPTSCSWLNMVEVSSASSPASAFKRGTFSSVPELQDAMERYIEHYSKEARPFRWTKSADHLLGKTKRKSINNTRH